MKNGVLFQSARKEVGTPLQTGKSFLCAVLALLVLTAALLPKQTAYAYTAPEFRDAQFHEAAAMIGDRVKLDVSCLAEGYVAVSAVSDMRLKFQVVKDETTYNYNLPSYSELYSFTCDVVMQDEFQPFLRPSTYINYNRDSACVRKAAELAAAASDELGLVGAVYNYVCGQVTYDREKAASVKSGYLPVPDETMTSGKGICFDYAALAGAMLRSQGIPTKMIFGYVAPEGLYHAWNMFYTPQSGWVTVSFEVRGENWTRMDLTFSANGADSTFIGDGSNYSDVYYY